MNGDAKGEEQYLPDGVDEDSNLESACYLTTELARLDYKRTLNPLHVWMTIINCAHEALYNFNDAHKKLSPEEYESTVRAKMVAGEWPPTPTTLPDWCMRYLIDAAKTVDCLSKGLDKTKAPLENQSGEEEIFMQAFHRWHTNPTLSPGESADRIASAFGFVRPGWNAFAEQKGHQKKLDMFEMFIEQQTDGGLSRPNARYEVMGAFGMEDVRSFRRIVSEINKEHEERYRQLIPFGKQEKGEGKT